MAVTPVEAVAGPDPEVRPARQVYPATYKLKVLAELDAADSKSERGEILRREGCTGQSSLSGASSATAAHSRPWVRSTQGYYSFKGPFAVTPVLISVICLRCSSLSSSSTLSVSRSAPRCNSPRCGHDGLPGRPCGPSSSRPPTCASVPVTDASSAHIPRTPQARVLELHDLDSCEPRWKLTVRHPPDIASTCAESHLARPPAGRCWSRFGPVRVIVGLPARMWATAAI